MGNPVPEHRGSNSRRDRRCVSFDGRTYQPFQMVPTSAEVEREVLALVGSEQFLIAFAVVLGIVVLLLVTLLIKVDINNLQRFDLENIVATLRS